MIAASPSQGQMLAPREREADEAERAVADALLDRGARAPRHPLTVDHHEGGVT